MKPLIFIATLIAFQNKTYSQTVMLSEKQRLITEIKQYDHVESYCLGFGCNAISLLYTKSDSLLLRSTPEEALAYFQDTSCTLKYYAFLHILDNNDSLAFALLAQNIMDEKRLGYTFADMSSNTKFIYILVDEYRNFINSKYLFGGKAMMRGHRILNFPPKDKKKYKRKQAELNALLQSNQIVFK